MASAEGTNNNKKSSLILGIDLGTTTVKVALVDPQTRTDLRTNSRETKSSIHSDIGSCGSEQDVDKILTALQFCVSGLPKDELRRVSKIGISGQMHGVVLWKQGEGWHRNNLGRYNVGETSALYTWQDGRSTCEFISTLPEPRSHLKLASGLGCVTLFWLLQNRPDTLARFDCGGTIQDFVVTMLCGLDHPVMSVHNAASWGYFDTVSSQWNDDILAQAGFTVSLLPRVLAAGGVAGSTLESWYGVPAGTPVGAALGDLQCSILSRHQSSDDAVLNISTSAQLAFQMHADFVPPPMDATSTIEYFPYFGGRYMAVAASLTGGNVMAAFVKMLQQWTHELGLGVPESKIWEKIHASGHESSENDLVIVPTVFGERHDPTQRATVTNITTLNTTLGCVFDALCRGIITNLHTMMSQDFLLAAGVKKIVGSGTALIRNGILRKEIERQYKLPLQLCENSTADAAVGAALAMIE